mmetsp:Transcript_115109/g.332545  ORF Transcript_115109/g.332545 Transcript_115109/m.332545 type:complete len:178 (+) Transcript_115109:172-705(+)
MGAGESSDMPPGETRGLPELEYGIAGEKSTKASNGAANPPNEPADHDVAYDILVEETKDSNMPWLFHGKTKAPAEVRDESYCSCIRSMDLVIADKRRGVLSKERALQNFEHYLAKIREIGRVDADRVRDVLLRFGIDDARRLELQHDYQELRRECGRKVPVFGEKGMQQERKRNSCC